MKKVSRVAMLTLTGGLLLCGVPALAQSSQEPAPTLNPSKQQQPQQQTQQPAKPADVTPLTLDNAPPPVNAEEEAAYKTFHDAPLTDVAKKNQIAEDFAQKYPQSRYLSEVYVWLVRGYLAQGQVDKMES